MALIILDRFCYAHDAVIGILWLEDTRIYTLELPWFDNRKNVSCIPQGRYQLSQHKRPSGARAVLLHDVPGRSEIMFHSGNSPRDTEGCILPGFDYRSSNTDSGVYASVAAFERLYGFVGEIGFTELLIRHIDPYQ